MLLGRRAGSALLTLLLLPGLLILARSSFAGEDHSALDRPDFPCERAEECFRNARLQPPAVAPSENRGPDTLQRLRLVRERHPGSVWANRAGLLMGLALVEREPAEAMRFFRAAQRDIPILDDYIRLWMGEALLRADDASVAAALLESIPEIVPETLLRTRVAYRAGEAWYKAGWCPRALDLIEQAVLLGPQDPAAPSALLIRADCQIRENRLAEGRAELKQIWARYPHTAEARDALNRLAQGSDGTEWHPTSDELYERALSFFALALHEEAVENLRSFLATALDHPRRDEARLKLGIALIRLKRYEEAKQVFQQLAGKRAAEASEAAVWLARVYLRMDEGERLLQLDQALPKLPLSVEQKASILLFAGMWLEDQGQYDRAIATYRRAMHVADSNGQRLEAVWRTGWVEYQTGRFREAAQTFQEVLKGREDLQYTPQALYWTARALDRLEDPRASEGYRQLCRQYPFTYYCKLAQGRADLPMTLPVSAGGAPQDVGLQPRDGRPDVERDVHFRKAVELKLLGLDQDAARELASLVERYARDRAALLELAALLGEAGAHSQALRVARLHFRDSLERGGEPASPALWTVAYPTAYLPVIRAQIGDRVDPMLVAAIIREESQYDPRAVSRVGAIGLMQVMPTTAQTMARRLGDPDVLRDDLFDLETNVRLGGRYLEQLLQQFSGNVLRAVAAYNAGPSAVSVWIAKYGDREPDEFVELIPYQETRQYVKRVLRSYREYNRLGRGTCTATFLDKTC